MKTYLIGWLGRATSAFLFFGPAWVRRVLGLTLGFVWFDVLRIRRRLTLDNVAIAFPDLSPRERRRIARRSLWSLGQSFVEYSFLPWLTRANYGRYVTFENIEILDDALARGRGVLLLTCHLGNGDLGCAALSVAGYPMVMVSKAFKARWLNDLWFGMRAKLGTQFVPARDSSYALLKGLKRGKIIVFPNDQFTGPPIGVRTTFFGRETGTAAGLAVMAQRSGAPVVSCHAWRRPDGHHVVRVAREIPVGTEPKELVTQRFNDELEGFIRRHPEQWMWIHRRWKKFKY